MNCVSTIPLSCAKLFIWCGRLSSFSVYTVSNPPYCISLLCAIYTFKLTSLWRHCTFCNCVNNKVNSMSSDNCLVQVHDFILFFIGHRASRSSLAYLFLIFFLLHNGTAALVFNIRSGQIRDFSPASYAFLTVYLWIKLCFTTTNYVQQKASTCTCWQHAVKAALCQHSSAFLCKIVHLVWSFGLYLPSLPSCL
jgi:hypothetical protein